MKSIIQINLMMAGICIFSGCRYGTTFPQRAMRCEVADNGQKTYFYDTDDDHQVDYKQVLTAAGRINELIFVDSKTHGEDRVFLNQVNPAQVPHFIIALDGVPYDLAEELYDQGYFRLFYPPRKMVSTFPAMTDLAFQRLFGGRKPVADQARYFNRQENRIINGNEVYLSGGAADWAKRLDFRVSFNWDPLAYALPQQVFEYEMDGMMKIFRSRQGAGTHIAYSVATAGLGTQGGREAILKYLRRIHQLVEVLVHERRGRVKITLVADHGHNMNGRGRVTFDEILKDAGYRLTETLQEPNDVVAVEYGLITYAAFFTDHPAGVAQAVLKDPATTVGFYPQEDRIVIQSVDGKAYLRERDGRYQYERVLGDPLQLKGVIEKLRRENRVDEKGYIEDQALFWATVDHCYPDPLHRIWLAFHGLMQEPPDLIVCLEDGWVHGSSFFHTMIGGASSTHGSLNRINSLTFAMTMLGELPPAMRLEEVMPALEKLRQPPRP